jgi:hypothetical protein
MTDIYTLPDLRTTPVRLSRTSAGGSWSSTDGHHAAYVKGANETLEKLHEIRGKGDFSVVSTLGEECHRQPREIQTTGLVRAIEWP